jgi:hypothetical protein
VRFLRADRVWLCDDISSPLFSPDKQFPSYIHTNTTRSELLRLSFARGRQSLPRCPRPHPPLPRMPVRVVDTAAPSSQTSTGSPLSPPLPSPPYVRVLGFVSVHPPRLRSHARPPPPPPPEADSKVIHIAGVCRSAINNRVLLI